MGVTKRKQQHGNFLVEIMLAGVILSSATFAIIKWNNSVETDERAIRIGTHLKTLTESVARFAVEQKPILTDHLSTGEVCDEIAGFGGAVPSPAWKQNLPRIGSIAEPVKSGTAGNDPACAIAIAPVIASSVGDGIAEVPISTLQATGYLPPSFPLVDENGASYRILMRRVGSVDRYDLEGLVVASEPVARLTDGGDISWVDIGTALHAAGANAGVVRTSLPNDVTHGFPATGELAVFSSTSFGSSRPLWWNQLNAYGFNAGFVPAAFEQGALVARFSTREHELRAELSSTSANPMGGNLKMGGFGVENIESLQIIGQRRHGDPCSPAEAGQIARMAGELSPSTSVTRLIECANGEWQAITGLRGSMTFDAVATYSGVTSTPSGATTIPEGISKVKVTIEGAGGGGGCGMSTYPVVPPGGFSGAPVTKYARYYVPPEIYFEDVETGSFDTLTGSCMWPYYGGGGCSSSMTNAPVYTNLMRYRTMNGHSFSAGGGGGGAGGKGVFLLNVKGGDEIRAFAGAGGKGCSTHPMLEPRSTPGVVKRANQIGRYVDAVDNEKEGQPSAILIMRDGSPYLSITILGGGAGRNGATAWCGEYFPNTGTYLNNCGWFQGEGGYGGDGMFAVTHHPSGTTVTPFSNSWNSDWGSILSLTGNNSNGLTGDLLQGNWIKGIKTENWSHNYRCTGGKGGGSHGGRGGDAFGPADNAGDNGLVFSSGGGGGGCIFEPIGGYTIGGDGGGGRVSLEW